MTTFLVLLFSYTIAVPAFIGAFKYKQVPKMYRPFIIFIWISLLGEISGTICTQLFKTTAVNYNIYTLVEFVFLLWIFKTWGDKYHKKSFYTILLALGIGVWVYDNFILNSIKTENSIFRIFYSLICVYLSIEILNRILFSRIKNVLKNAIFIVCIAFIVFYAFKATFEVFFVVQLNWSMQFYKNLFTILIYANLFGNLLFTFALICIPKKQKFILQYL